MGHQLFSMPSGMGHQHFFESKAMGRELFYSMKSILHRSHALIIIDRSLRYCINIIVLHCNTSTRSNNLSDLTRPRFSTYIDIVMDIV